MPLMSRCHTTGQPAMHPTPCHLSVSPVSTMLAAAVWAPLIATCDSTVPSTLRFSSTRSTASNGTHCIDNWVSVRAVVTLGTKTARVCPAVSASS